MAILRIENLTILDVLYFFESNATPEEYVAFRFIRMVPEDEVKIEGKQIYFNNRTFVVTNELSAEDMSSKDWMISKIRRVDGKIHFDVPTSMLQY